MKTAIAAAAFASALALALGASAQGVAQRGYFSGDIGAFHGDAHSLIKALRNIQLSTGARVVEIRFTDQGGLPGYHVVLKKGHEITFMHLDESGGQVVALAAEQVPSWMMDWKQKAQLHFDRTATVPLARAIRTAEQANGGYPAIAAGIAPSAGDIDAGVHAYNVLLDVDGKARRVAVDARNGEIITDPQALSDDL